MHETKGEEDVLGVSLAENTLDDGLRLDEFVPWEVEECRPGLDARSSSHFEDDFELVDLVLTLEHRSSCEQLEEDTPIYTRQYAEREDGGRGRTPQTTCLPQTHRWSSQTTTPEACTTA
jgi:hypothetical protein